MEPRLLTSVSRMRHQSCLKRLMWSDLNAPHLCPIGLVSSRSCEDQVHQQERQQKDIPCPVSFSPRSLLQSPSRSPPAVATHQPILLLQLIPHRQPPLHRQTPRHQPARQRPQRHPLRHKRKGRPQGAAFFLVIPWDDWCGREDSNFHVLRHSDLNAARLPIPPRPHAW